MLIRLKHLALQHLVADTPPLLPAERWKSALGVFAGLFLAAGALLLMPAGHLHPLAVLGATATILFAVPHSPMAQPWSVFGSYLAAVVFGLAAPAAIPWGLSAGAVALAATVWFMTRYKCVHPPAGALVLLIVADSAPSLEHSLQMTETVMANAAAIVLTALLVNNLLLRRRYPQCRPTVAASPHLTADPLPSERTGLSHEDLEYAVQAQGSFVDIQESELLAIYRLAVDHAFERHLGMTCGDIMARDVVTVEFGTPLEKAWNLLRHHRVKALPVVDHSRRVLGIVSVADFLRQLDDTTAAGVAVRLQGLLRRLPGMASEKAEVVGEIMSTEVSTATVATPVVDLVHRLSDQGLHHIPVVNRQGALIGMVTQSDLITALYRRLTLASAERDALVADDLDMSLRALRRGPWPRAASEEGTTAL